MILPTTNFLKINKNFLVFKTLHPFNAIIFTPQHATLKPKKKSMTHDMIGWLPNYRLLWHPVPQILCHLLLTLLILVVLVTRHLETVHRECADCLIEETDAEFQTAHHMKLVILQHSHFGGHVQKCHTDVCYFGMRAQANLRSWFHYKK